MPFKITLLNLAITYYFSNKKRKQIDKLEVEVIFCLVIVLFNQSKNNAVLEPRTGPFRGLVGFLAKAKDFKKCPLGQGRPRGLHSSDTSPSFSCFSLPFE